MASNEGFGGTDRYTILELNVDFATPANTTLTRTDLAADPYDQNLCGFARNCIPQPGTNVGLDAFGGNTLFQAPVRDLDPTAGVDLRLLAQGPVDVNGADLSGIRWVELQNTGGGWSVRQQSTFAPADGRHRWMGSIAMNGAGDIAMGYSVSSSSTFPAIWATGRLAGDPLGSMTQGETVLRTGVASQRHSSNRWGDYAVTNVDPVDDQTFWHVNEYITAAGTWSTHIAHFELFTGPVNQTPVVTITAPSNGSSFNQGVNINFTGTASDTEDGDISGDIDWTSSINGFLDTGASINTSSLSVGTHTITASATDSGNPAPPKTGTDQITVTINPTDIHVESITTETLNLGQGNKQGRALVEIRDDAGNTVAGADVKGVFSGAFNETQMQTTNGSGVAEFLTIPKKGNANFSFCVSGVVGSLPYDPNDNASLSFACGGGTLPDAPTTLTATAVSSSQIDLGWTDNANDEDGFEVEWSLDGNNFSHLATLGSNVTSYSDTGLSASTTYFYRVRAFNGSGNSAYSNTANATTQGGGNPTDVHVEAIATSTQGGGPRKRGRATVTILDDLGNPASGYNVTGIFTGSFDETKSGTTGANGQVTLTTSARVPDPMFDFCVDSVSGALPYNAGANVVTCSSFPAAPSKGALAGEVPDVYALEQNFPNPFNPSTVIAYSLAEAGAVRLKVYNVLGQEVATLVDGYKDSGRHQVVFDASRLSAGIYLYVIEAGSFTATQRMTLLK